MYMKRPSQISLLYIVFFACILWVFACTPKKEVTDTTTETPAPKVTEEPVELEGSCSTTAKVVDFRGLSSCQFLFQLEDGSYLMPLIKVVEFDRNRLENAKTVSIDYSRFSGMSTCMKGTMVKVSCISILEEGVPEKGRY